MSIVGQLRLTASVAPGEPDGWTALNDDCCRMLREAADEIERLRSAAFAGSNSGAAVSTKAHTHPRRRRNGRSIICCAAAGKTR
jgi:hypothetical protein